MTKPANFPGRKNKRRIEALGRMGPAITAAHGKVSAKIIAQDQAEAIRTKKDRRARAKV